MNLVLKISTTLKNIIEKYNLVYTFLTLEVLRNMLQIYTDTVHSL